MKNINTVIGSVIGNFRNLHQETVTDVGAFETKESQEAYLLRYLPYNLLDPTLSSRIGHWLHGRYSITLKFNC